MLEGSLGAFEGLGMARDLNPASGWLVSLHLPRWAVSPTGAGTAQLCTVGAQGVNESVSLSLLISVVATGEG